jgi:hypothetical protein
MSESIFAPIKRRIREFMNEAADHLASGGAQSFEEYQRMVGRVDALAILEREIIDIEERMIDE